MGNIAMSKQTIKSLVGQYVKKIQASGIPVEQAIVFGSQTKGTAHKWSDIDTCIVSPLFGHNRHTERLKLMFLTDRNTDMIEPHPYHPNDLADKSDPLAVEILKHGMRVL